jgi:hypothetical protein
MKLTLRELFLLVVIAAMGCGWWVEHRDKARVESENQSLRFQIGPPPVESQPVTAWKRERKNELPVRTPEPKP